MYIQCFACLFALLGGCGSEDRFAFTRSADGRIVYRHDSTTGQTWVSRNGGQWEELEDPALKSAREEAQAADRERAARSVLEQNGQHPERFRQFAKWDRVTVLSEDPRETLRGCEGMVFDGPSEVSDSDSGVVRKLTYQVSIRGTTFRVDADKLALVGSTEEWIDLAAGMPNQWSAIVKRRADERREEANRRSLAEIKRAEAEREEAAKRSLAEIRRAEAIAAVISREKNPALVRIFQNNDAVVVLRSDPRPLLRGKRGRVAYESEGTSVDLDGRTELVARLYRVVLADPATWVTVEAQHLEHEGR